MRFSERREPSVRDGGTGRNLGEGSPLPHATTADG
jgi:hypothetical protein